MVRFKRGIYYVYKRGRLEEFDTHEEAAYFDKNGQTMQVPETRSFLVPDEIMGSEDLAFLRTLDEGHY